MYMIKIALAVPCRGFIENAPLIFQQHNDFYCSEDNETYSMEEVIVTNDNAKQVKLDADIILTRGLLAEILANLPGEIPVVQISIPTADILRAVRKCTRIYGQKDIAIIAAGNMLAGITGLYDLCDAPIKTYLLSPSWNNEALVDQAVSEGCQIILGGVNTCRYADMIHVPSMVIQTSKEAFWGALTSVKRTASIFRKEQEKAFCLHTILDTSHDGIIFIDQARRVTTMNIKAHSILDIQDNCLGRRILDIPFPLELKNLLSDNREYSNELLHMNRTLLNISKTFVKINEHTAGSVITLQLVNEIQSLEGDIRKRISDQGHVARLTFDDVIGISSAMTSLKKTAVKYSATSSNILLIGESGTGKEVFAQSIHNASSRKSLPFVAVNCAAIPENLLESELFGYVPGAFTGARKNGKAGLFELAHRGTIFLDEIGEIPMALQAKLLRVLQEREIMRVGGDSVTQVDIRIIAATNKKLEQLVKDNLFREDLFYRLDVLRITIPPLDKRRQDIPLLIESYMEKNFPDVTISEEAKELLSRAHWAGNVRQLFNICERLAVLCSHNHIDRSCVELVFPEGRAAARTESRQENQLQPSGSLHPEPVLSGSASPPSPEPYQDEAARIQWALGACRYHKGKAAVMLGISRSTLWRKIQLYHIED